MNTDIKCPNCGSYDIDQDSARGDASCVECGTVLEQNLIVNEVAFVEDARGRSNMIGQHVRADGRPNSFNAMPGYTRQATELTLANGRRRIVQLVSSLKLNSHHTDAAHRLFKLAVERNFHKGRRLANVCCACLYVVCRTEQTSHMLLDFADVLETNLYVLGHTFLKFTQVLSVQLPIIDPSLYIHRFASKLEFGDMTHAVAITALRIVARMHRDWLSHGRRPSGLCGAALVCAAGIHNFHRSIIDVCRVVRVGNVALRDRLEELNATPTATLTAAQIDAGGGDDGHEDTLTLDGAAAACDPPAFQRLQNRKKLARKDAVGSETPSTDTLKQGAGEAEIDVRMREALASVELQELERESREEERVESAVKDGREEKRVARKGGTDADSDVASEQDVELSDMDEEDTAKYLNTEEEFRDKEMRWTEINKDYLEQQERLARMKRERPEEFKRLQPWREGRKKSKKVAGSVDEHKQDKTEEFVKTIGVDGKDAGLASGSAAPSLGVTAAAVAAEAAAAPRKASKKLNYSVWKSLKASTGQGATATMGATEKA